MSCDRFCVLHPFTARFCGVMMSLETSEHPPLYRGPLKQPLITFLFDFRRLSIYKEEHRPVLHFLYQLS